MFKVKLKQVNVKLKLELKREHDAIEFERLYQ